MLHPHLHPKARIEKFGRKAIRTGPDASNSKWKQIAIYEITESQELPCLFQWITTDHPSQDGEAVAITEKIAIVYTNHSSDSRFKTEILGELNSAEVEFIDSSANDGDYRIVAVHLTRPSGRVVLDQLIHGKTTTSAVALRGRVKPFDTLFIRERVIAIKARKKVSPWWCRVMHDAASKAFNSWSDGTFAEKDKLALKYGCFKSVPLLDHTKCLLSLRELSTPRNPTLFEFAYGGNPLGKI